MATFIVDAATWYYISILFPYNICINTVLCIIILGIFCTRPILPSEYNTILNSVHSDAKSTIR